MTFTMNHLSITKDKYEEYKAGGKYYYPASPLSVKETAPEINTVRTLITRIGWGWATRPQYATNKAVQEILDKPECRLHLFQEFSKTVGYCLTHDEDPALVSAFSKAANDNAPLARIEQFGFFPENTGKGYGHAFMPHMLEELFNNHNKTYLTSRGTNDPRVVPFYLDLGFDLIHREEKPDDPILEPEPFEWRMV